MAKEVGDALGRFRPLLVAGAARPAGELRRALLGEGDPSALRDASGRQLAPDDLTDVSVLVYVAEGELAREDERALRLAERAGVERVCVLVESATGRPAVPPAGASDLVVVSAGEPLPVGAIAERVAEHADELDYVLASRLPPLRRVVAERIVRRVSRQNGVLGAAIFIPGADLPALTVNQLRMVFRIGAAYGERIDRERGAELVAVVGAGVAFRALAREALGFVPVAGWAVKGGVAYTGTRALGETAIRYFERRQENREAPPQHGARSVRPRS
ncbi:MAG: DUF697 domain-containing protein [Actinomycetota bacterium]|nr:DUF697 domain-containing protein [Actinomycetota bacterium]